MNLHPESPGKSNPVKYQFSPVGAKQGVGWFSCVPETLFEFDEALRYSRDHPYDQFMHKHLLEAGKKMGADDIGSLIRKGIQEKDPHLLALMYETCLLNPDLQHLTAEIVDAASIEELQAQSPLIYIPWSVNKNSDTNFYWLRQFSGNFHMHRPLPSPDEASFPIPFERDTIERMAAGVVSLRELPPPSRQTIEKPPPSALKNRARELSRRLEYLGVLAGWESRPDTTLSPFAIERPWNLDVTVVAGRNHWRLTGQPTSYGRGVNVHQGRISCLMEAVERYSAFASVSADELVGYRNRYSLLRGRYQDLSQSGHPLLDPASLCLETPYREEPLYWVRAEAATRSGPRPIWVPVQLVTLFSNLDEIALTTGLPSTGIAAGNSLEEAKLSAVLEVIERDAERVVPYRESRSFLLEAEDDRINDIIGHTRSKGIHIQFLDITSEFGIPCYQAFVQGPTGSILKGSGCHLDGRRAIVSALTEIPYPYPYWFGSAPPDKDQNVCEYESLPDYSSGDPAADLKCVEEVLERNGYQPVYIDLTREDTRVPVVKALIPGLEIMTGYDRFTPLGIRQFAHYINAYARSDG